MREEKQDAEQYVWYDSFLFYKVVEELIFLIFAVLESPRDLLRTLIPGSQPQQFWFIWSGTWPGHREPLSGLLLKWVYAQ